MNQENFSPDLLSGMQAAVRLARMQHAPELFTVHVLTALSAQTDTVFVELLKKSEVDIPAFHAFLADRSTLLPRIVQPPAKIVPSSEHSAILSGAQYEARLFGDALIDTEHILLAALKDRPEKELWRMFGLSYESISSLKERPQDIS